MIPLYAEDAIRGAVALLRLSRRNFKSRAVMNGRHEKSAAPDHDTRRPL